jgi:hypothetical protein
MIMLLAVALAAGGGSVAPKPLYRDPVHDGAADPSIVWDRRGRQWLMFYTNRRADLKVTDPKDVSWVHGTHIGIAQSRDGAAWDYKGRADIPAACTGPTLWAPNVEFIGGTYHMWLTVVPGVYRDWNAPRFIVHLTSRDLKQWKCGKRLDLGSDRVIDATVAKLPVGRFRLWFNDERQGKSIRYADSPDLETWRVRGTSVDTPGEGPKVFRWEGQWWMISDAWKGLLVMRSADGEKWIRQEQRLLEEPGSKPTDRAKGQHPDVVVSGERAYLYYFVHQGGEAEAMRDPAWERRTVIQVAELIENGGTLSVDRDAPVSVKLATPQAQR